MAKITTDDLAVIIKKEFEKTDKQFGGIKKEIRGIKAAMVTKDYLDEKLADLRGDLVVLTRKEDQKLKALIEVLKERKVISKNDEERILALEPFPELSLHVKTA